MLDLQLSQIVKVSQQYFKFEDVIESLVCDPVEEELPNRASPLADTEVAIGMHCFFRNVFAYSLTSGFMCR